jgi:hypothetical protein
MRLLDFKAGLAPLNSEKNGSRARLSEIEGLLAAELAAQAALPIQR